MYTFFVVIRASSINAFVHCSITNCSISTGVWVLPRVETTDKVPCGLPNKI
jgi:hypothetical protein